METTLKISSIFNNFDIFNRLRDTKFMEYYLPSNGSAIRKYVIDIDHFRTLEKKFYLKTITMCEISPGSRF